jgi:histidine triad (HIT) family protein
MKKILLTLLIGFGCVGICLWIFDRALPRGCSKSPCVFCNPKIVDAQKFYEDDLVLGLCDYKPISQGHLILIPKRHVERLEELTDLEMASLFHLIQKTQVAVKKVFQKENYVILQKNGASAGQTVFHVHIHFIPRAKDENSLLAFLFRFCLHPFKKPLSETQMEKMRIQMSEAL